MTEHTWDCPDCGHPADDHGDYECRCGGCGTPLAAIYLHHLTRLTREVEETRELVEWVQANLGLHYCIELVYTVDGYEVTITHKGSLVCLLTRPTLAEAIRAAMQSTPTETPNDEAN